MKSELAGRVPEIPVMDINDANSITNTAWASRWTGAARNSDSQESPMGIGGCSSPTRSIGRNTVTLLRR